MKSIPIVGRFEDKRDMYMLVAIKNVVNEAVDDGGFADSLIPQEYDFIFEKGRNAPFTEVEVADVCHGTV
jgi:hypothetical protein